MSPRLRPLRVARLGLLLSAVLPALTGHAFGIDDVAEKARALAAASFRDPRGEVPGWLLEIGYDQWRDIRFRTDRALWREAKLPFEAQFFHPGLYYDRVVRVHEIDAKGVVKDFPFSPDLFDYGRNEFASRVPQDLGFAGFRLHYPLKSREYKDELIVFLGASYFRALGREHVYGLSARGLAIDTALSTGEEFPFFKEFWLERPRPGAKEVVIYALLDSPSVTGAYRFAVRPGVQTVADVDARVFFRRAVAKLGYAPLTSMYFFGEGDVHGPDYRPEVHDSDGILIADRSGEWSWRPLANPRRLRISAFSSPSPVGFGLLQRDRSFDHYQDLETRQEQRPSAWVAPKGEWGPGHVELVEIPTDTERHDNIVAYWVPKRPEGSLEPASFRYELRFYSDDTTLPPGGRAVATRRDRGTRDDAFRYVVDFEGTGLSAISEEIVLQGVVSARSSDGDAEILEQQVQKNPVTGGWRLVFQVRPRGGAPVDLRAFLRRGEQSLTETWVDTLEP
jgi:glucans biosynthesis protein